MTNEAMRDGLDDVRLIVDEQIRVAEAEGKDRDALSRLLIARGFDVAGRAYGVERAVQALRDVLESLDIPPPVASVPGLEPDEPHEIDADLIRRWHELARQVEQRAGISVKASREAMIAVGAEGLALVHGQLDTARLLHLLALRMFQEASRDRANALLSATLNGRPN